MKLPIISTRMVIVVCVAIGTTLPISATERRITGVLRLSSETSIKVDQLTFDPDSEIITNGYNLTIAATTVSVGPRSRIVSFEGPAGEPGEDGRSGGVILLRIGKIEGGSLVIDDSGQAGAPGAPGKAGQKGLPGNQGTQRDWNPFNGCIGGSNGTPGHPGQSGQSGGNGGDGGSGGTVLLSIKEGIGLLKVQVRRGVGGMGGTGGSGGPGGDGGQGAPGKALCGGTDAGPPGTAGPTGPRGQDGKPGREGSIVKLDL